MKILFRLLTTLLISIFLISCQNLSPKVVEISLENDSGCTYISNLDALLETYVIHKPEVKYGGSIGYSGITVGGNLQQSRDFISLQTKLSQQGAAINSAIKTIIILGNKSCNPILIERAWESLDNLIKTVGKVYSPILEIREQKNSAKLTAPILPEYQNREYTRPPLKDTESSFWPAINLDNALKLRELLSPDEEESTEEHHEEGVEHSE